MNKKGQKKKSKFMPALHSIISEAEISTTFLLSLDFAVFWQTV